MTSATFSTVGELDLVVVGASANDDADRVRARKKQRVTSLPYDVFADTLEFCTRRELEAVALTGSRARDAIARFSHRRPYFIEEPHTLYIFKDESPAKKEEEEKNEIIRAQKQIIHKINNILIPKRLVRIAHIHFPIDVEWGAPLTSNRNPDCVLKRICTQPELRSGIWEANSMTMRLNWTRSADALPANADASEMANEDEANMSEFMFEVLARGPAAPYFGKCRRLSIEAKCALPIHEFCALHEVRELQIAKGGVEAKSLLEFLRQKSLPSPPAWPRSIFKSPRKRPLNSAANLSVSSISTICAVFKEKFSFATLPKLLDELQKDFAQADVAHRPWRLFYQLHNRVTLTRTFAFDNATTGERLRLRRVRWKFNDALDFERLAHAPLIEDADESTTTDDKTDNDIENEIDASAEYDDTHAVLCIERGPIPLP